MPIDSPRLPPITTRDEISPEHHKHFDSIADTRGSVRGPFTMLMHSPEIAGRAGDLGAYIRYESSLPGNERELAIITAAREFDSPYEWAAHARIAKEEGISQATIDIVADRLPTDVLDDTEALIIQYGRELFQDHEISPKTYAAATERYTNEQLVELTATMGYYGLIACILNAFNVLPNGDGPTLPMN